MLDQRRKTWVRYKWLCVHATTVTALGGKTCTHQKRRGAFAVLILPASLSVTRMNAGSVNRRHRLTSGKYVESIAWYADLRLDTSPKNAADGILSGG